MSDLLCCRAAFAALAVIAPVTKAVQLHWWSGSDAWRQLVLVAVGAVAVAIFTRKRAEPLLWSQLALPRPPLRSLLGGGRLPRLLLGSTAVAACGASVVAAVRGEIGWTVGLTFAAFGVVVVLAFWEAQRHRHAVAVGAGAAPGRPDRAVLWTVAPAVLLWTILVVQGAVRDLDFDGELATQTLFLGGAPGRALFTILVIGIGEEYFFRGLLVVLAVRARLQTVGLALISVSFGAWHIPDEWSHGAVSVAATFVAMAAVSQFVLLPVRLRSRSLAGPTLLHTANNLALNML